MVVLILMIQVASVIWVGFDARGREFTGHAVARSARGWVVGCALLWIICFPLYLAARSSAPRKGSAPMTPPPSQGPWSHPEFSAPTAAPERMSVPPPPKR
jgi:hypothetical protein